MDTKRKKRKKKWKLKISFYIFVKFVFFFRERKRDLVPLTTHWATPLPFRGRIPSLKSRLLFVRGFFHPERKRHGGVRGVSQTPFCRVFHEYTAEPLLNGETRGGKRMSGVILVILNPGHG